MNHKYKLHFFETLAEGRWSHWDAEWDTPEEVQDCIEHCRSKRETIGTQLVITVYKLEKTVTLTPSPATVTVVE